MSKPKEMSIKNKIIHIAIEMIATHGFENTSFEMIARKCKISTTSPFYYFKNKDELLIKVIEYILESNQQIVNSSKVDLMSSTEKLVNHFRMNYLWSQKFPEQAVFIQLLYYKACYDKKFSELYKNILLNAREKIRVILLSGIRENAFRSDLNVLFVSEILHDYLLGSIVTDITVQKSTFKPIKKNLESKWDHFLKELVLKPIV